MRGSLLLPMLLLAGASAWADRCPGDRAARLGTEPGAALVTLDDGVTRVVSLPGGTLRERREGPAPTGEVVATSVTVGELTWTISGDCRKSELSARDAAGRVVGTPVVTRGLFTAMAAVDGTVVALRHDGVLVVVPVRGRPRPRVVGWRQAR